MVPQPKTISINERNGKLDYKGVNAEGEQGGNKNATIAGANKGETVVWECNKDYFIIDFGSRSPFKKLSYIGNKNNPIIEEVRELGENEEGPYKYSVTVHHPNGEIICSDDPVLIVPPVRGGGS